MNQIPVVSVVMITYGQENYIREAIEGVLMQSCDFEIELIVANDCSPDNTDTVIQDIIQNNSNGCWIRYFKQEKNIGMMPNFIFALQQATSKYIALCDGDDYWTDPLKLQKQVDFLEENPDYILTHTNVLIQEESSVSKNVKDKGWNFINNRLDYRFAIFYPLAFTCSAMFRNIPFCDNSHYNIIAGDWKLWTQLTLIGKAKFMNFESSVYRKGLGVSVNSIWHKDYPERICFLFNQLSFKNKINVNKWLLKGIFFYALTFWSIKYDIKFIKKIARYFRYKIA